MCAKYFAGDFPEGTIATDSAGILALMVPPEPGSFHLLPPAIHVNEHISEVSLVTEENKSHIGAKLGWGGVGLVALGPIGAIAGLLLGGNGTEVCVMDKLTDGRKFMTVCSTAAYQGLLAGVMKHDARVARGENVQAVDINTKGNAAGSIAMVVFTLIVLLVVGSCTYMFNK